MKNEKLDEEFEKRVQTEIAHKKQMKKIFRVNANGTKTLVSYDYDGVIIELDYKDSRSYYNPYRRDGYLVPQLREILGYCWFETLREAKELIDKYLGGN